MSLVATFGDPDPGRVEVGDPAGDRRRVLEELSARLSERGISALLVRAPGLEPRMPPLVRHVGHDVHLIVRPRDGRSAAAALDGLGWALAFGGTGPWRWVRCISYHWDGGPSVSLHRGVSAAPLPPRALRKVERALWSETSIGTAGFLVPDASWMAVFVATQAARPGPLRQPWLDDVAAFRAHVDWARVEEAATAAGVGPAVSWARDRADQLGHDLRQERAADGPLLGGIGRLAWSAALAARRRIRPWPLRAFMSGVSAGVGVPARARFAGIELAVPSGVFVPQAVSLPLVEAAARVLPRGGVAIDVGTGSGAVALALSRARPDAQVHGVDISREAVRAARRNRKASGMVGVRFHVGSVLSPIPDSLTGKVDVIVANLPYVPPALWGSEHRDKTGTILGKGDDGLALQRTLARQALAFLSPGGSLLLQLMAGQWGSFAPELRALGYATGPELGGRAGDVLVAARAPSPGSGSGGCTPIEG